MLGDKREWIWAISPYHNLQANLPPAIAFHGKEDCTVPLYTVNLFRTKTLRLGNYFDLIIYEGRKHYLGINNEEYSILFDEEILQKTDDFLKKFDLYPGK